MAVLSSRAVIPVKGCLVIDPIAGFRIATFVSQHTTAVKVDVLLPVSTLFKCQLPFADPPEVCKLCEGFILTTVPKE